MYQRNAEQRNKTNLILVSYFFFRFSLKSRPKSAQSVRPENLKFGICSQYAKSGERKKKHEQNIYRKPMVTLRLKSTHQLQA